MTTPKPNPNPRAAAEETLDPADWSTTRALGQRMLDDALAALEGVRSRPVWTPIPGDLRDFLAREVVGDEGADPGAPPAAGGAL